MQSDDSLLSTVLIAPTSRSAQTRVLRPTITIGAERTQVLIEQTTAVAPQRLGDLVGRVNHNGLERSTARCGGLSDSTDRGSEPMLSRQLASGG